MNIEEIKRLNEARTQGEWVHTPSDGKTHGHYVACNDMYVVGWTSRPCLNNENAAFIAAAPQIVAFAIAKHEECERLRAALRYYADESNYWNITDGGKCHEMTNADQGELARKKLGKNDET